MKQKNTVLAAMLIVLLVVAVAIAWIAAQPPTAVTPQKGVSLQITEICSKNETIIADNDGKFRDYIELYAPEKAVSLDGYVLTDGKITSQPLRDITIGAGEYYVLFLCEETTGFALRASGGDVIQLKDGDGAIAAQANTTAMAADQAMIWGDGKYSITDQPSPGFPNTGEGERVFREGYQQMDPKLTLSELLVHNKSIQPDERGIYSDIVELYNSSEQAVNLGGYFLSDSLENRFQYRLPNIMLDAGSYTMIYCDGENYVCDGYIHANFGLSKGESIYLTDSSGGYLSLDGDAAGEDMSVQLAENGEYVVGAPSLGYPNTPEGVEQAAASRINAESALIISEVLLSSSEVPYEGAVTDVVEIMNRSASTVSTAGWYLSDGGDPYSYALPRKDLKPGESLVIKCDHSGTGFGLSQGEVLRLTGPDYRSALPVTCTEGQLGQSMSYIEDGYAFGEVTLGHPNDPEGRQSYLKEQLPQDLQISEVMTGNLSYLPGAYGVTCDWVELYNAGSRSISLQEYTLTDNSGILGKCELPQITVAPGEYVVLLLDKTGQQMAEGYAVLPMELSAAGEQLYLSRQGEIVDFAFVPPLYADESFGRANGTAFSQLAKPTPGTANSKEAAVSAIPVAITEPGCYDGVQNLEITLSGSGTIYYTTNCQTPTTKSQRYTGPITVNKTTVIRAVCCETGKTVSPVMDATYILNEGDDLPVVSLVTSPANLWDKEKGIYADGPNITTTHPYYGANFWEDWEVPASVSLYKDGEGGFSLNCGLKIFGGFSRATSKKSFSCMFRRQYGASQLDYPLFGEGSLPYYESFVLRAGGQDVEAGLVRDEMITSLAHDYLGLPVQRYKSVALYLNGKYWGLYFIREKLNENYVAGHFNAKKENVTLAAITGETSPEFLALRSYAQNHDLSQKEHYDYIASQIDLENYTDYIIAQLWIANVDSANVKYFKTDTTPWTWILYDTDLAMRDPAHTTPQKHLRPTIATNPFDPTCATLAVRLLANEQYRDYFIGRIAWQVNNVWTQENVISRLDTMVEEVSNGVRKDNARWEWEYDLWQAYIRQIRMFVQNRNSYFLDYVQAFFSLTDQQMRDYGFPVK